MGSGRTSATLHGSAHSVTTAKESRPPTCVHPQSCSALVSVQNTVNLLPVLLDGANPYP